MLLALRTNSHTSSLSVIRGSSVRRDRAGGVGNSGGTGSASIDHIDLCKQVSYCLG